jgi:hypothetical protein
MNEPAPSLGGFGFDFIDCGFFIRPIARRFLIAIGSENLSLVNVSLPLWQRWKTIVIVVLMQPVNLAANGNYCKVSGRRTARIKTKLVILKLFASLFGWMWISAAIASIYFLYVALASAAPWSNLLWSIGAALIAKYLAIVLNRNKQRVDYVDQLMERGYTQAEATQAWNLTVKGGANLLLNLQQTETIAKSDLDRN